MLIYSPQISSRLQYVVAFTGKEIAGKTIAVTTDKESFSHYEGVKINYSRETIKNGGIRIIPHSLLFETAVKEQSIHCFEWNNLKAFFKTEGDIPFDLFAASFYLLSRYEEYLPHQKDEYGRFDYKNSLAYKEGFLNQPLVNKWIQELKKTLQKKFTNAELRTPSFSFLPTYDIDEAYSFLHKQWWRLTGGIFKDIVKGNVKNIALRKNVLSGKAKDPYDAYQWMNDLHERYGIKPLYFFLVARANKKYDKNILPSAPALQALIKQHADRYAIGVHPSWQSGDDSSLLQKEKEIVQLASGKKITASRQHYIRFILPHTFRVLIDAGIEEDYSMGYGSINGFRASVASSFFWYDLENEEQTSLQLFPFCYMDANSFYEQQFSAADALKEMKQYYHDVKAVNGMMITIWHNNFFGSDERFKGWKEAYEAFVKDVYC